MPSRRVKGAARGIRANDVIPGPVGTQLRRYGSANVQSRSQIQFPLGRQVTAWDIAYATVFMLSGGPATSPESRSW
jgi:NAD(P)-dependent dehydrogenase (short-subunit alcohol dehydrogenase family)